MTTAACAPPGAPFWAVPHGSAANSLIWPGTGHPPPRPTPRPEKRIGRQREIDLRKRTISTRPKQPWLSSSPSYRDPAPKLAHGSRKTSLKASPFHSYPSTTANGCARQTRWSGSIQQGAQTAHSQSQGISRLKERAAAPLSAVLVEIDEKWASDTKAYIKWECQVCHDPLQQNFQTKGCSISNGAPTGRDYPTTRPLDFQ